MPETPTPKDYEDLKKDPFDKQKDLQDLTKEIDELKDDKDQNDIIENNVVLNNALNGKIQEYLKNNEKVTELIVAELDKIIKNPETSDSARKSAESLLNLIKSIQSTEERPEDPETTEQSQEPKLGLKGQIGEITPLPDGGTTEGRFHSDLVKEKPENLTDNEKGGPLDLWRTENQFQEQGKRIAALLAKKSELNNDEDFKNAKNLVDDILKVIENPVGPNVEKLQIFVYENLDGKDKEDFHLASFSKKDQKFDGKFGVGTLAGLNKVLEKTEKYIKGLEDLNKSDGTSETLDKPGETPENLDNVKLKNNDIKVKKGGEVKPEEWLEGLPQGAKVDIKEGQSIDMNNTEPQTITLVVTGLDGKTKEIEAKITVVENVDSDPNKPPQYPQEIVDNNGVKHPILPESQTITQNLKLNGAALYSVEQSEGLAPDEHEYIMKLGNNPENVYKIKVDKDGLCPTAENFNSKVKILFKNNPACMSYLQAKAPEGAKIGWHNGLQDYTITLNGGKTLTIEPMTIDGKWVSPDLKQCLALLNFTNFLTSAGKIDDIDFKNKNDPDLKLGDDGKLYVRVNKKEKWGEDGKGGEEGKGWYPVPMERFGLVGIDQNVLKKFIKYNNGEDWNDNWDKKDDNKGYKKIDFPVAVREGSADRNGGNGGAGLIGGGEGIIDPTLTQGRVVRGTEAPRVTEGEKISLDENTISKLNVDVLENPTDVAQKFAIPENAVVYKAKDSDTYYYKEGNDVVCIGLQPGQEWKKWKLGGEEGKTYSEGVNVCSEGKNRLNFILKDSLKELSDAGLIKEEEIGLVSISIEENDNGVKEYSFVNGGKKIPIYDVVLMGPNIENKLKSVYLASKIVPGEFELKDGNIVAKGNGTDGLNLSSDELLKYGLEGEEAKKNFVDYLNTVSDDLVDDEVDDIIIPSENLDGDNETSELTDDVNQEISGDQRAISDADFDAMKNLLGEKMFIEKGDDGKISYSPQKAKDYLSSLRDTEWEDFKGKFGTPEGRAWLSAVQILLNAEGGDKIKVDGKFGQETKNRVIAFQENYNSKEPGGVDLKVDGFPGKDTLAVLIGGKLGDTILEGKRKVDNNTITFLDGTEIKEEDDGRKFIEVEGNKYYEYKKDVNMNGLGYRSGVANNHIGYFFMGNYVNGKLFGEGTMTYADGNVYKGNWENNKLNGEGTYIWANGESYKGNWENNNRNGEGTMTYADGDVYKGNWENNKRNGEGTYIWANGNILKGTWNNNDISEGKVTLKLTETELDVTRDETKKLWKVTSEGDDYKGKYIKDDTGEFVEDTES